MRLTSPKKIVIFCSLLYSLSALANSQHYLVEDIKNLNLYLWNGLEVKDRILIGYNLSGGMDFNATTGLICGGVGEASSYLWAANVKSGLKKIFFRQVMCTSGRPPSIMLLFRQMMAVVSLPTEKIFTLTT